MTLNPSLLNFYDKGLGDMHSYVASNIFGIKFEDIIASKKKKQGLTKADIYNLDCRQKAKGASFAINYGGSAHTVAYNLDIPMKTAQEVYDGYFDTFPGLQEYFQKLSRECIERGYIVANELTKRRRYFVGYKETMAMMKRVTTSLCFPDRLPILMDAIYSGAQFYTVQYMLGINKNTWDALKKRIGAYKRLCMNTPIQGTAGDMTKFALVYFRRRLIAEGHPPVKASVVKTIGTVHDEIMAECDEYLAEDVAVWLQEAMEDAGRLFCKRVPIVAKPMISNHWTH